MTRKEKIIEILRSKTVIDKMGNLLVTDNYNDIADAILVALPIEVPSEEEIEDKVLEWAPVYYIAESNDDINANIREEVNELLEWAIEQTIKRNQR